MPNTKNRDNRYDTDDIKCLLEAEFSGNNSVMPFFPLRGERIGHSQFGEQLQEFAENKPYNPSQKKQKILAPLLINENHWVLLCLYFKENEIRPDSAAYFDSLDGEVDQKVKTSLNQVYGDVSIEKVAAGKLQKDGYNCGPWVVEAAKCLAASDTIKEAAQSLRIINIENARAEHKKVLDRSSVLGSNRVRHSSQASSAAEPSPRNQSLVRNSIRHVNVRKDLEDPAVILVNTLVNQLLEKLEELEKLKKLEKLEKLKKLEELEELKKLEELEKLKKLEELENNKDVALVMDIVEKGSELYQHVVSTNKPLSTDNSHFNNLKNLMANKCDFGGSLARSVTLFNQQISRSKVKASYSSDKDAIQVKSPIVLS